MLRLTYFLWSSGKTHEGISLRQCTRKSPTEPRTMQIRIDSSALSGPDVAMWMVYQGTLRLIEIQRQIIVVSPFRTAQKQALEF